jgi:hypothetical protein
MRGKRRAKQEPKTVLVQKCTSNRDVFRAVINVILSLHLSFGTDEGAVMRTALFPRENWYLVTKEEILVGLE